MSNYTEILNAAEQLLGHLPVSKEGGRLRNIVYVTSTANYEKPAWLKFAIVKGVGGGGGGGGVALTSASQMALAAGGGGGGYFEKRIAASDLSASETVTIGAGGAGGLAGANTGSTGDTTSFGSHCSASGGVGGEGMAAVANTSTSGAIGGLGGEGVGGDYNESGNQGQWARIMSGGVQAQTGNGGGSKFSPAGAASRSTQPAQNGTPYGMGGSGAQNWVSTAAKVGGNGAAGIVIIEEYE